MKQLMIRFAFLFFVFAAYNQIAHASPLYKKVTKIDFSKGALLNGEKVRPDAAFLEARRRSKTKKFFLYRKNFSKKIRKSVNELGN